MPNIDIIPLFDQTSPMWHDFASVRLAAQAALGLPSDGPEYHNAYTEYAEMWRDCRHVISFGAYDGDKMVGFINGECKGHMNVAALYIVPRYWEMGIGRHLLTAAERAASMDVVRVSLTALTNAVNFYLKQNYTAPRTMYERYMEKDLRKNGRAAMTVPVFRSTPKITRACRAIYTGYDAANVNGAHNPMFAYVDIDGNICGFIDATGVHVASGNPPRIVERTLQNRMNEYMAMRVAHQKSERE